MKVVVVVVEVVVVVVVVVVFAVANALHDFSIAHASIVVVALVLVWA